jgi:hypothetical protein
VARANPGLGPFSLVLMAVIACAAGYATYWWAGTASNRQALAQSRPELEWLRREYGLNEARFQEIQELEAAYAPRCVELCAKVSDSQARLAALVARGEAPGPAMETAIQECARVEAECRQNMLEHLRQVSLRLAPEQREPFLNHMTRRLLHPTPLDVVTGTTGAASTAGHEHHAASSPP